MHSMINRITRLLLYWVVMALLLTASGCMGNPRSETIVIPESEADQPAVGANVGKLFQVKTIYPLEKWFAKFEVLGWTNEEEIVGYASDNVPSGSPYDGLQLLAPPFDQPKQLTASLNAGKDLLSLSPDGRLIASLSDSKNGYSLELQSVDGRQNYSIDEPVPKQPQRLFSRNLRWSNDSRYLSYLVLGDRRDQLNLVVYNVRQGSFKQLALQGMPDMKNSASAVLSEDGNRLLIDNGRLVSLAELNDDGRFVVRYDHASTQNGCFWVDANRFIFLGADGTLFQYDSRNGELTVLLEKIVSFSLSPDRKMIAYTQNDGDIIYAGKLQGNNLLSQTAVYQGFVPSLMKWSIGNGELLVAGSKPFNRTEIVPAPVSELEGTIALHGFIIDFQDK
ncbi:hypothetical protein EV294_105341 [Paenibacillus sp. BK033]|uniref:WD40 repeat domain-containing protein n=1 Tax=Paenibacillus sp. BK033 TaxID=2512133 RepID=UPI00104EF8B8|nr:WD40 repeat domain-containing protein [Paenibacillus sp. BK033]TCM96474.1 hypothetical protein EV294_105341 [Paenibacillus sp. BK033]